MYPPNAAATLIRGLWLFFVVLLSGCAQRDIHWAAPIADLQVEQIHSPVLDRSRIQYEVATVYGFYRHVLGIEVDWNSLPRIKVFADVNDYVAYIYEQMQHNASRSKGIFMSQRNTILLYRHPEAIGGIESTYATLRHELSHALMRAYAPTIPDWINEGLAEQLETITRSANGSFVLHANSGNRKRYYDKQQHALDLKRFITLRNDLWRKTKREYGAHQYMAGQLFYWLLSHEEGVEQVKSLLEGYHQRQVRHSYLWLQEHYPGGVMTLAEQWQKWHESGMVSPSSISFPNS